MVAVFGSLLSPPCYRKFFDFLGCMLEVWSRLPLSSQASIDMANNIIIVLPPGIISVLSLEQLLFIYNRLQFTWQFRLCSISISYYQSPCGRCWVILASIVGPLLTLSMAQVLLKTWTLHSIARSCSSSRSSASELSSS